MTALSCRLLWFAAGVIGTFSLGCRSQPPDMKSISNSDSHAGDASAPVTMPQQAGNITTPSDDVDVHRYADDLVPIKGELEDDLPPPPNPSFEVVATHEEYLRGYFPAVSVDGRLVALMSKEFKKIGEHKRVGLFISIIDVESDNLLQRLRISFPGECDSMQPATCSRLVKTRLRAVNKYLARYRWEPLIFYRPVPGSLCMDDESQELILRKLSVSYRKLQLRILRADGTVILDRTYPNWITTQKQGCRGSFPYGYIFDIGINFERRVVFIDMAHCVPEADGCETPEGHSHVYRLPPL